MVSRMLWYFMAPLSCWRISGRARRPLSALGVEPGLALGALLEAFIFPLVLLRRNQHAAFHQAIERSDGHLRVGVVEGRVRLEDIEVKALGRASCEGEQHSGAGALHEVVHQGHGEGGHAKKGREDAAARVRFHVGEDAGDLAVLEGLDQGGYTPQVGGHQGGAGLGATGADDILDAGLARWLIEDGGGAKA